MSIKGKILQVAANLHLSFDVGHSSIGWAVLQTGEPLEIKGCGSVVFRADDCLASSRRAYRRQRRHIRSTRQRIARMKILLQQLGVLTGAELVKPGCAWPWKLAAQVLQGGKLLTWPELWDGLRWYAHNRGYDGNRRWSAAEDQAQTEDSEKEAKANMGPRAWPKLFAPCAGSTRWGKRNPLMCPVPTAQRGKTPPFPAILWSGRCGRFYKSTLAN